MALRPCLVCGVLARGSRCIAHTRPERPAAERHRRTWTVQAWRATYGDWCPGWRHDPHRTTDLTADHVTPVAAGGSEDGPLTVLCRSCNARKRDNPHE